MENTARILKLPVREGYGREPDANGRLKGNGRAIAVAKFRELADRLESGELDGARVQWLDTHGLLVEVEDAEGNRRQIRLEDGDVLPVGAKLVSGLEFVTRSAWSEDGSGTVQLTGVTIEEEN
ncbi:MAG TPA: hypothetical protein VFR23_24600 [Jiangellaceae bacterium]|nr:hypothetical protein [Jiangellaceae bacterium]